MKVERQSFVGKTVFIGIDVHKRTYSYATVMDGVLVFKVGSTPADPVRFLESLKKKFLGATLRTAYEAGFSGFVLHRTLTAAGIDNIVVNAASIEIAANDRVKTDKRDATKIALQLSRGMLRGNRVPSLEEELGRQLTRTRAQLIKQRTRTGNQIKSKLFQFGLIGFDDERAMSAKFINEFKRQNLPSDLALAIEALSAIWHSIQVQVKILDESIDEQSAKHPAIENIYRSVPGVGRIIARTLANELNDMSQFANEKQLYSFVGLTPTENSSGPNIRRGHISKQGSGVLRCVLVEAAWMAKDKDPELDQIYERLKITCGGKRAIVAVARRLVGRIRACLRQKMSYELCHNLEMI